MIESVVVGLFRGSRLLSMRRARKSFIISEGGPGDPPNCIYCAPGGMTNDGATMSRARGPTYWSLMVFHDAPDASPTACAAELVGLAELKLRAD